MDRILAMSLVGPGPCNVFGPSMSAGALESFARDTRAKAESNSRGVAAAGGARSASAGSGGKCGADQRSTAAKEANGVGGQEGRGAGVNETRRYCTALDGRFCFDAVVAPY